MFGAIRRFAVPQVLRASALRSVSARWAPQSLRWQAQSVRSPALGRSFQTFPALRDAAAAASADAAESSNPELVTEFADLKTKGLIDPSIVRNLTDPSRMGLQTMTEVQSQTISQMLRGEDVLAQAKTGTGKTLAFLVPSMHNILSDPTLNSKTLNRRGSADASDIRALIISPTRELAEQIAAEAYKVAAGTGLKVRTAVGGTHKHTGLMKIQNDGCHLLVGTPGRLKDIFSDPASGVSAPRLNTLILDEADRLLDEGFSKDIQEIQELLPDPFKVDRQTLMLSATVPRSVMQMVTRTMKPNFKFVKTIRDDEVPTHLTVPQRTVFLRGYENALPAVLELVKNYQARQRADPTLRPFKAIVYFNTTKEVHLAATTFENLQSEPGTNMSRPALGRLPLLQIHASLTQAGRTHSARTFREASEGILFSTDVTARGMDFPNVTHIIQVGVPRDRETYIHRLGRTARANKTGEGWLFLHDGENRTFERALGGLPLKEDSSSLPTAMVNMTEDLSTASPATKRTIMQVKAAMKYVSQGDKAAAYKSQMTLLTKSFSDKRQSLRVLKDMAFHGYGLRELPAITPNAARMYGVQNCEDINVKPDSPKSPNPHFAPRRHIGIGRDSGRNSGRFSERSDNRGGSYRRPNNRGGGHGRRSNFEDSLRW